MPAEFNRFIFPASDEGETSRSLKSLDICNALRSENRRLLLLIPMRHGCPDALFLTGQQSDKCLSLTVAAWTDNSEPTEGWEFVPRISFLVGGKITSFDLSEPC